jgi:putative ABC transport system ATP-binding protein
MVIQLAAVSRTFKTPAGSFNALSGVDLSIDAGHLVAVTGKSGSGKSTLLNLLGGLDRPSSGSITVGSTAVQGLSEAQLARWRGRHVGVVFQFFQLLPTLTVTENVRLPMDFAGGTPPAARTSRALALLDRVGVADQAGKFPATLSGGQQQRVAIARAMANEPAIVLADEPTGNLDSVTALGVIELFRGMSEAGVTVVIATHEREIAAVADRVIHLVDGRVAS